MVIDLFGVGEFSFLTSNAMGMPTLFQLPPDIRHQLLWNHTVNTHGGLGRSIPCDLHNKHVNEVIKEIILNMGANLRTKHFTVQSNQ